MTDERAERAFRTAFERHAADAPTNPLDVRRGARRRRWVPYAAAASVLVVLAGGALATLERGGDDGGRVAEPPPSASGAFPAPEPGMRWVSFRDVAVQVPDAWGYGREPGPDWCAGAAKERAPFVDVNAGSGVVQAIGCPATDEPDRDELFGPAPERLWTTHVALEAAEGEPDRTVTEGAWTVATRTVGDVRVRLLTDDTDATDGILESARTFATDQHGCDASSPVQADQPVRPADGFDVTELQDVDDIAICQYQRRTPLDEPGLIGSRSIEGAGARRLLAGLQQAPPGGGPDRPQNCDDTMHGDTAIVLRLRTGDEVHDVHVYFDWCTDNGSDDGTTKRALTAATCAPLFAPPVVAWSYQSNLRQECGTDP